MDLVVLSYSDLSHEDVMHKASVALARGASYELLGPNDTMLESRRPVISVCAVRTGAGKSPLSRYIARLLRQWGHRVAVIRHPMPYGDLRRQAVQRFARYEDLETQECTIEEREEYEPHLQEGAIVWAGVDYERILRAAEREYDVVLWDGGNNDLPFYRPNLHIVVADPHRGGHELRYHPGEANFRMADIIVASKANTARAADVRTVRKNARRINPSAPFVLGHLRLIERAARPLRGKRVVVVEDGPTATHGGMPYGAGTLVGRHRGARLVDPRPYAVGSLRKVFRDYPHLQRILPAMGYSARQVHELEETIRRVPCDVVIDATPAHLGRLVKVPQPIVEVAYEYGDPGGSLKRHLHRFASRRIR